MTKHPMSGYDRSLRVFVLALCCVLSACSQCGSKNGRVPFQQTSQSSSLQPEKAEKAPFVPAQGDELPPGSTSVTLEGTNLSLNAGQALGALSYDVDEDGDRDAFLLSMQDNAVTLSFANRDGSALGPLQPLASKTLIPETEEDCKDYRGRIQTLSTSFAVATLRCASNEPTEPTLAWVILLGSPPQVRETLELHPKNQPEREHIAVDFSSSDNDGDGHEDVSAKMLIHSDSISSTTIALSWLDHPAALTIQNAEPKNTIGHLADEAYASLASDKVDEAISSARKSLLIEQMLCREGSDPRLVVGGRKGIECSSAPSTTKAAVALTLALQKKGNLIEALRASEVLTNKKLAVSKEDQQRISKGFVSMSWGQARWRRVATHPNPAPYPHVRLPLAAITPEGGLLLRGEMPQSVDAETGAMQPLPLERGDASLMDRSGQYVITSIRKNCRGVTLGIGPSHVGTDPAQANLTESQIVVESTTASASSACRDGTSTSGVETGWHVLGWAPQGIVLARGPDVRVVPVQDGKLKGSPWQLADNSMLPAPLPPGGATPDGTAYAIDTKHGVLVRWLGGDRKPVLINKTGVTDQITDVAIDPSGDRIIIVRGADVWIVDGFRS